MKEDRRNRIVELVTENKKISVSDLSQILSVSKVTIRKDLSYLSEQGIIKRMHNFAQLLDSDNIKAKLAYHFEDKLEIAKKASQLVNDGDSLIIESGSSCAIFARELARTKNNLTIISNSIFIADYIGQKADFQIILLGGILQQRSQVMIGSMVAENVRKYQVDKMFIGTDGYSKEWGFSNRDSFRAEAVEAMAKQAREIIVLTESQKFVTRPTLSLNLDGKIKKVITDKNIDKEILKDLSQKEIDVIYPN